MALCTCKQAPSSTFLCTGSTSHHWPPSCPQRAQTPLWSPLHPPHQTQGCHAHSPKAQPLAPASPKPPWLSPGLHHYFFLQTALEAAAEKIGLRSVLDCQTVEENGSYIAAGLPKGLTPVHILLCGLVPCIIPPVANARCLFTVWGVFPITASKSKQIYTIATRRSPDNMLSGFLSLMRSISHGDQDYHSFL